MRAPTPRETLAWFRRASVAAAVWTYLLHASPIACPLEAAQARLDASDFESALSELEECAVSPESARLKGLAYHGLYRADSAARYLRQAVEMGRDDDRVLIALAETHLWGKRLRQAAPLLDKVRDRQAPAYLRALALRQEQQDNFPEALALYNSALEKESGDGATLFRKAMLFSWMRRLDESIALYTRLIGDTSFPEAFRIRCRVRRAEVMAWNKEPQPAERELREVLRVDPRNVDALLRLGELLEWRSNYREAKDTYRDALVIEPENREAREKLKGLLWVK